MSSIEALKPIVEEMGSLVITAIMHILKPADGHRKFSNAEIKDRYRSWQAIMAACDEKWQSERQAIFKMPPEDEDHKPCRFMAAVRIQREICGEQSTSVIFKEALKGIIARLYTCAQHTSDCECHHSDGWTGTNKDLFSILLKDLNMNPHLRDASGSSATRSVEREMSGSSTGDELVKGLFETVQGVKFDSQCPHELPFYACMACSH
jgi:hypothetical protein